MRVGICAYWFNRGQGVVARQIRSALDELGHETFVLARPTRAKNIRPSFVDRSGVWDQPGVTEASAYRIGADELVAWGREHELELALFDQNYEFESIEALRATGVTTVGRFVWEQFSPDHVGPAQRALETIYSLTACEQTRYATMGIDSPRVRWGIHPELLEFTPEQRRNGQRATSAHVFLPGRLPEQAQARRRGAQGLSPLRRPEREAGDQGPGGAGGRPAAPRRRAGPAGGRGAGGPAHRRAPAACSQRRTSASRPAAGRDSGCTSTSRWRSGCR